MKVDRSFVRRMSANADDAAIVRTIVDLGGALGLRVVAEGVEDRASWERLSDYGCDAAQGWHLARAMPAVEATPWLRGRGSRPPPSPTQSSGPGRSALA